MQGVNKIKKESLAFVDGVLGAQQPGKANQVGRAAGKQVKKAIQAGRNLHNTVTSGLKTLKKTHETTVNKVKKGVIQVKENVAQTLGRTGAKHI
jgi:hypothetical protein